jgi:hypothetical protein
VPILVLPIKERTLTEALRAQSKEFMIKKYSELGKLCASAVNKHPDISPPRRRS